MKIIFVVGTTASGKSNYAMSLAKNNKAAIVNCDSIQLYQGLKIGSALPSEEAMKSVPHYLFSYVPKGEKITAGQYARDFYDLIAKIKEQYEYIYVVGGTGFYFQAIERGMFFVHAADDSIRKEIEKRLKIPEEAQKIYKEFKAKDPKAALKIFPNDHYRLARAMELMQVEGKTLTQIQEEFVTQKKSFPWQLEKIGLKISKEDLLPRVKARTKNMLEKGLVKEVEGLLAEGYQDWEALQSVGYKETLEFILVSEELSTIRALEEKIIQSTMKLAKKQRTWFRRDPEIQWRSL